MTSMDSPWWRNTRHENQLQVCMYVCVYPLLHLPAEYLVGSQLQRIARVPHEVVPLIETQVIGTQITYPRHTYTSCINTVYTANTRSSGFSSGNGFNLMDLDLGSQKALSRARLRRYFGVSSLRLQCYVQVCYMYSMYVLTIVCIIYELLLLPLQLMTLATSNSCSFQ